MCKVLDLSIGEEKIVDEHLNRYICEIFEPNDTIETVKARLDIIKEEQITLNPSLAYYYTKYVEMFDTPSNRKVLYLSFVWAPEKIPYIDILDDTLCLSFDFNAHTLRQQAKILQQYQQQYNQYANQMSNQYASQYASQYANQYANSNVYGYSGLQNAYQPIIMPSIIMPEPTITTKQSWFDRLTQQWRNK